MWPELPRARWPQTSTIAVQGTREPAQRDPGHDAEQHPEGEVSLEKADAAGHGHSDEPRSGTERSDEAKKSRGDTIRTCDLYVPNVAL